MFDALIVLLPVWGLALIAFCNAVGRCGIPLPSSALMITFGAIGVSNVPGLIWAIIVAYGAAIAGDLVAYPFGKRVGDWIEARGAKSKKTSALMRRAEAITDRWGIWAVLITRWPLSTLGPYVNLIVGAAELGYPRFLLACLFGEFLWVSLYLSLGYAFSANLDQVLARTGQTSLIVLGISVVVLAVLIWRRRKTLSKDL